MKQFIYGNQAGKEYGMENREKILLSALHLFYLKGYDAVGVQEIADTAGITKPTMYYYFNSKSGLLAALLATRCEPLIEEIRIVASNSVTVKEELEGIAKVYLQMASVHREFYFFMTSLFYAAVESEAYQLIQPYLVEQFQVLVNVFDGFAGVLGNMNGRQKQFAVGFIGLICNYILVYYQENDDGKALLDESLPYHLVHQFMHGIFS